AGFQSTCHRHAPPVGALHRNWCAAREHGTFKYGQLSQFAVARNGRTVEIEPVLCGDDGTAHALYQVRKCGLWLERLQVDRLAIAVEVNENSQSGLLVAPIDALPGVTSA